jgi:serine/threonine-protein kinase PknK
VLGPLDETAVAALCAQTLGAVEPAVARPCTDAPGACPSRSPSCSPPSPATPPCRPADVEAAEVPGRARDVAARRVAALPVSACLAALAVAWLGDAAAPDRLRALVPDAGALERCRAEGLVALRADGSWSLRHGAYEEALVARVDAATREALRRSVAEELDRAAAPITLRAEAWLRAGDLPRAQHLADDAVAALRANGLPLAGVRLLAGLRAATGATAARRYLEAELLMEGGRVTEAEALAAGITDEEPGAHRRARLLRARLLRSRGDVDGALALLDALAAEARDDAPDLAAEALVEAGRVSLARGDYALATSRCDDAAGLARDPIGRAQALSVGGVARVFAGQTAPGLAALEEARGTFASRALPREEATLLTYLAVARERGGDLAAARALHESSLDRARAAGDLRAMVTARINLGNVTQRLGDLGAALEHTQAALQLSLRAGLRGHTATARMNLAIQLLRIGSIDRVRAELDAARAIAREAGNRDALAAATLLEGDALARGGDADAGLARIAEAEAMFSELGATEDLVDALLDGADVLLERAAEGDLERAAERLGRARAQLGEGVLASPRVLALEGTAALLRGDARGALRRLTEAVDAAGAESWEVRAQALAARARAHASVGADLHARRDRERAVELLEEKAAQLPPDLRGAFWSVPRRAALRAETSGGSVDSAMEVRAPRRTGLTLGAAARGLTNVNAQTLIASDERLVLLLEMTRRLGEEPSLERVLEQAVRSAVELTNAERGAVLLPGPQGALVVRVRTGPLQGEGPDDSFSQSIADAVWIDGEPVVTLDAQGDRRFADFRSVHELGVCAVAAVPMRAGRSHARGALRREPPRRVAWSQSDVALMAAFGGAGGRSPWSTAGSSRSWRRARASWSSRGARSRPPRDPERELEATRSSLVRAQEALRGRFAPAGIVANTAAMQRCFAVIERVRDTDVPVVVEGESGTGKELVARALHFSGARAKGPFVVVHCGAIPETLMESELFGHVKGAFTGADRDRKGLIASAHGGTLFLDEVGEMSPRMQVELLRVLQDRKVRPVGGARRDRGPAGGGGARTDRCWRWSPRGASARTCTTASRGDPHASPAARARRRHPRPRGALARGASRGARRPAARLSREALRRLMRAPGPATCGSSGTRWRAPRCCARARSSRPRRSPSRRPSPSPGWRRRRRRAPRPRWCARPRSGSGSSTPSSRPTGTRSAPRRSSGCPDGPSTVG